MTLYSFKKALPVWPLGRSEEMNLTVGFTAAIRGKKEAHLALACASSYILTVNGCFVAHGPARAAHGYYRVDEYDLSGLLQEQKNVICVRVAGYNANSFAYLDQPSFLCAEIYTGDTIIAHTSDSTLSGFYAVIEKERVQKVVRYSFQRPFSEAYSLSSGAFQNETSLPCQPVHLEIVSDVTRTYITRDVPYGEYRRVIPARILGMGTLSESSKDQYYNSRQIRSIGPKLKGYPADELELAAHVEYGKLDFSAPAQVFASDTQDLLLPYNTYMDLSFGREETGIFDMDIESTGGRFFIAFDEIRNGNLVNPFRLDCLNIIECKTKPGHYHLTCAEPYSAKFVRLISAGGECHITHFQLIRVAFPAQRIVKSYTGTDPVMQKIFDAAVETFSANSTDIFMDCPSRERAGWLCDSFFTSRVEKVLTGRSDIETAFLENFLLPDHFDFLPDGMLPMCYPADHNDGCFIPNWAMWYVLEMEEYIFSRDGSAELLNRAKSRIYALMNYLKAYENSDGLLESLPGWVFVEWSKANELTQDVNFPTNMLYARCKSAVAHLYDDPHFSEESVRMQRRIRELSLTPSGFYCDNMLRKGGNLVSSGERTEACQYYAFYFGIATAEKDPWLWDTLLHKFGYNRSLSGLYPEIHPANAFIGNYLRLELLEKFKYYDELYDNIKGYFEYMADATGTLWENINANASCDHGFASHVLYWMERLGLLK